MNYIKLSCGLTLSLTAKLANLFQIIRHYIWPISTPQFDYPLL